MGRQKKVSKPKEPVRIRQRKLKNGNISLYLDIYSDGVRKYESLSLYLVPEKDPISKDQNRHAMQVANKVKSERILGLQNRGIKQWEKIKQENMPLLTWLCKYEQSDGNFAKSTLKGRKEMRQDRTVPCHDWRHQYLFVRNRCGFLPWLREVFENGTSWSEERRYSCNQSRLRPSSSGGIQWSVEQSGA